ncbi:hypothetical protein NA57DRAFT_70643 [Rhizodiscina lignyota]|uniref:F-box domain-containing protein n=1 Tax=Rhizodiscina lignyota TaxID=1504668 RepID=A0A9P4IS91_9PEZI|nr:hypothetical protein NA57DRAFT_70643 [Rhizodiscina lignyota]
MKGAPQRVFSVYELVEPIMLQMEARDVMSMEATCVWFKKIINSSHGLKHILGREARSFLALPEAAENEDWQLVHQPDIDWKLLGQVVELNPSLRMLFRSFASRRLSNGWILVMTEGRRSRLDSRHSSWKKLQLTKPACRRMRLEPAYLFHHEFDPSLECCENWNWGKLFHDAKGRKPNPDHSNIIENEEGITIRQFAREFDAAQWNWFVMKIL